MVVAETYFTEDERGRQEYVAPAEITVERDDKGKVTAAKRVHDGADVIVGGMQKMSKSLGNGVDPQEMIDRYGADTVRLFSMFASPPDQSLEWNDAGVEGASRFIRRFYNACREFVASGLPPKDLPAELTDKQRALRLKTHQTIAKVTDDMQRRYTFNTAIAAIMELLNESNRFKACLLYTSPSPRDRG